MSPTLLLITSLVRFLEFYSYFLIARILLSWFPNIDWSSQPFAILEQMTEPYLRLFRSIIPPLGGLDLSPILAFILLSVMSQALMGLGGAVVAMSY